MIEGTDGIASASHTGKHNIRLPSFLFHDLLFDFFGDHSLEVPDHGREGMGPHNRAKAVMCIIHPAGPLSHSLGNSILQCRCTGLYRNHFRTKETHTIYVQCLTLRILFTHENHTLHAKQRCCRSCGNTMLPGTCFSDQSCFTHFFRQQSLTKYIVDLMGTGMVQILSFQINFGTAQILCHLFCIIKTAGTACIIIEKSSQLSVKFRIILIMVIRFFQLDHGIHQCFRNILTTMYAKASS